MIVLSSNVRPKTALFHDLDINQHVHLYGLPMYASTSELDFLDFAKNHSFPTRNFIVFIQRFQMNTNSCGGDNSLPRMNV